MTESKYRHFDAARFYSKRLRLVVSALIAMTTTGELFAQATIKSNSGVTTVTSQVLWFITNILAVTFLFVLIYYIVNIIYERQRSFAAKKEERLLISMLKASGLHVWIYDVRKQMLYWSNPDDGTWNAKTLLQFFQGYTPAALEKITQSLNRITSGEVDKLEETLRSPFVSEGNINHEFEVRLEVLRRDEHGRPRMIIGTHVDISRHRIRMIKAKDTRLRYQAIFDTVIVDMVYFDKEGTLKELNEQARLLFFGHREAMPKQKITLTELYGLNEEDLSISDGTPFYATIRLHIPFNECSNARTIWYELRLQPLYDANHELSGIYAVGRDMSETSHYYHVRQEAVNRLELANKKVQQYIDNINYTLKVGGIRFVTYTPSNHCLQFFDGITSITHTLTQMRSFKVLADESRNTAQHAFMSMDDLTPNSIDVTVKTIIILKHGMPLFLQFVMIPMFDTDGSIKEYFGFCRNVSELKNTEEQLEHEAQKAQDVETVKNAFLHNMNYEIRTPLNSIVGFAEFFQQPHTLEDERIFIKEIKENAASLLKLVNNILFLSRLDAHMIDVSPKPTDFALMFDSMCNTCWSVYRQDKTNVKFIVDNPFDKLVIKIDSQNIELVLQQLISNSVQFTAKGFIRLHYDYTGDHLIISIEDTGSGIPSRLHGHIFDRFSTGASKGTGLGLSICHELVRQMGGHINIRSEESKGTTVWFSIPCEVEELERKTIKEPQHEHEL